MYDHNDDDDDEQQRKPNALPVWGNDKTMNLNSFLLTNIQSSHYFKVDLFRLKTYHEVVDEIYYNVGHTEPWEKGSRKTGQTGMCGGVRGVGTGGIVSTAFSCLYKLFTLRLTRKQVTGLLNHTDSPYIRAIGFLYLRYTHPPDQLYSWFEPYLEDEEMIDVRAGGGEEISMGQMCRRMLSKLDWYGTLFPRIPVPIEMKIKKLLGERFPVAPVARAMVSPRARDDGSRAARASPAGARWRDDTTQRQHCEPSRSRDIAEEIAMEKERVRRERGAGLSPPQPPAERERSRGRAEEDEWSRGERERNGNRRRDRIGRESKHGRSRSTERVAGRGSRDGRRHRSGSRESRRHRSGSRESRRHRSGSRESRRHRSGSRESRRHRSRSRDSRRHGSKKSRRHRSGSRESKRHKNKESRSRRSGSKESRRQRSGSKESRRQRSGSRESRRHRTKESRRGRRSRSGSRGRSVPNGTTP